MFRGRAGVPATTVIWLFIYPKAGNKVMIELLQVGGRSKCARCATHWQFTALTISDVVAASELQVLDTRLHQLNERNIGWTLFAIPGQHLLSPVQLVLKLFLRIELERRPSLNGLPPGLQPVHT